MNKIVGISLGKDCLPASWGVHNNYRKRKSNNYNTCPFDLMISNYEGVVKCILEDFKNFTNPEFLEYNNTIICNRYYNFNFNHETPGHANLHIKENWIGGVNHFINDNFKNFIKRYNNRIKNFINYLNNNKFINFILFLDDETFKNNCEDLKNALSIKYPKLKYSIIIIDGPIPHDIDKTKIVKIIKYSNNLIKK